MPRAPRQAILIGNTGFLGRAIEARIRSADAKASDVRLVVPDHRSLLSDLLDPARAPGALASLQDPTADQDWIVAAGLVDPAAPSPELERINVDAPLRLAEHLGRGAGAGRVRLITFGSVLEGRPELARNNPYLGSKARLFEAWRRMHAALPVAWIHVQLHTLYGGLKGPHPFMFTGQMLKALTDRSPFHMSGGEQVREYHHVDDIAENVVRCLAAQPAEPRLLELSSGRPIRLRDLATSVFGHFGALHLLSIGARPAVQGEVYENVYARSPELAAYREPCAGVIAWLEQLGVRPS